MTSIKEFFIELIFGMGAISLFFALCVFCFWIYWYFSEDRKSIDRDFEDFENEDITLGDLEDVRMDHFIKN